jgi:hypothetical protein
MWILNILIQLTLLSISACIRIAKGCVTHSDANLSGNFKPKLEHEDNDETKLLMSTVK